MLRTSASEGHPSSRGGPPLRRLLPLLLGVLVLVLSATVALAANGPGEDNRSDRAEQADRADNGNDNGSSHCDEEDSGPGHSDCKPDNNPQPDNPPCDADHGHPADNAKQCQEGPENAGSCEDGVDNDGDGLTDGDDPDCDDGGNGGDTCSDGQDNDGDGDADGADAECQDPDDGVEDGSDEQPDTCSDGQDNDGDGDADGADAECQDPEDGVEDGSDSNGGDVQNLCTAAADDPGLPLTEDTLGQTLWDGGLDALSPLTEDPERNGALSGALGDAGTDTPLEPVTDEAACAVDLVIDEELGGDL